MQNLGTKTSTTVDVTAGSSLDSKSNSINSLAFKPGARSTSTAPTSTLLEFSVKNSSTMSTNYEPDVSVSLDPLLAGILSVVGILCIAAVAIVVVLLIIIRTVRKKTVQIERLVHPCTGNGVHKYCHDCSIEAHITKGKGCGGNKPLSFWYLNISQSIWLTKFH